MTDRPPPILLAKRPAWNEVVPGSAPRGGFTVYRGSGAIGGGGKVSTEWVQIIYEDQHFGHSRFGSFIQL